MKKNLSKILARMAKDGDIETVAEIIGELIEDPDTAAPEITPAEPIVEEAPVPEPAPAPAVAIVPETDILRQIAEKLDTLIALLTPAQPAASAEPAADEEEPLPSEEVAEVLEEAMEAAEAVLATEPVMEPSTPAASVPETLPTEGITPEEVSALIGEILEPVAEELAPDEPEDPENPEEGSGDCNTVSRTTSDALRVALTAIAPTLARYSKAQRNKICADLAYRLRHGSTSRSAASRTARPRVYDSISRRRTPDPAELGRRIMEKRNINYQK